MMTYKDLIKQVYEIKENLNDKDKRVIEKLMNAYTHLLIKIQECEKKSEEYAELYKIIEKLEIDIYKLRKENNKKRNELQKLNYAIYKMRQINKKFNEIDNFLN